MYCLLTQGFEALPKKTRQETAAQLDAEVPSGDPARPRTACGGLSQKHVLRLRMPHKLLHGFTPPSVTLVVR